MTDQRDHTQTGSAWFSNWRPGLNNSGPTRVRGNSSSEWRPHRIWWARSEESSNSRPTEVCIILCQIFYHFVISFIFYHSVFFSLFSWSVNCASNPVPELRSWGSSCLIDLQMTKTPGPRSFVSKDKGSLELCILILDGHSMKQSKQNNRGWTFNIGLLIADICFI